MTSLLRFGALALVALFAFGLVACSDDDCEVCIECEVCEDPIECEECPTPSTDTHVVAFTQIHEDGYQGTDDCLSCHAEVGRQLLQTGHWNWAGVSEGIEGYEDETHGKVDLINNFCIAIPSNEGRCTQCHIGIGWSNKSFDHEDASNIDCLICHDTTGTYAKQPKTAGAPDPELDLNPIAQAVGTPTRANCGKCHFFAGGGDNVKHGDLAAAIADTTREYDVHMGTDGGDFSCQRCHTSFEHGISGQNLHSRNEGEVSCIGCHGDSPHDGELMNEHVERIACQTCHIPAFSRQSPTKMEWYWDEAGQDVDPIPVDQYGKETYNKLKGRFVWGMNVRPELRWYDGQWKRVMINVNDQYTELPAVLAEPTADIDTPGAKLYPFKKMIGKQAADQNNQTLLVPHLFGMGPGPNPYWAVFDWDLALAEGAAYAGQTYTGDYEFIDTVMYLSVNHEVAPASQALSCNACHSGGIDFTALGYSGDPRDD